MLNHVELMGNLVRTPVLNHTNKNNIPVTRFEIAVDMNNRDHLETDFIECVAWGSTATYVAENLEKGSLVVVTGQMKSHNWTDKNEMHRKTVDVRVSNICLVARRPRVDRDADLPEEELPEEEQSAVVGELD